jgi:hypothetical protein
MRGHIITEERFLHQGIDHHLFVTDIEGTEHEYRFEVRRIAPGGDSSETIYETTEDLSSRLANQPETEAEAVLWGELERIKKEVLAEENLHANDP